MAARLSVDLQREGAAVVLRLSGQLDELTVPLLAGALTALVADHTEVRLDLEDVRSIDRAGLDLLLSAQADASVAGVVLEIEGLQASLRRQGGSPTRANDGSEEPAA